MVEEDEDESSYEEETEVWFYLCTQMEYYIAPLEHVILCQIPSTPETSSQL